MPLKGEEKLQYNREYMRKLTESRRHSGRCLNCGELAREGKTQCQKCADFNSRRLINLRKEYKSRAVAYLGGKCVDCGLTSEYMSVYDFHHLGNSAKESTIARLMSSQKRWEPIKNELDKCILLCANCHRIRHEVEDGNAQRSESVGGTSKGNHTLA